ncbi:MULTISPECIES: nucleoid occlusion factor SlmA [Aliagarivorans]|uniref:nucleoid occlusion factor SlmA n=1 Tax=Aliagarivorans TaxID=882379 RepID=UPI000428FA79|nr:MULTISPECIES: nucleoid occlusion factor SlmA [Aliagarivorans]
MAGNNKTNRREQILQALAQMLESNHGQRITTANLAKQVGVSEAALYRHFPSKARMFEGLIEFIEEALLSRINLIQDEQKQTLARCQSILLLILGFCERNPGLSRIITGDALQGEHERLRARVSVLFEKIELQLKQVLRERKLREGEAFDIEEGSLATLLLAYTEGRVSQYVRSEFKLKPTAQFDVHWQFLESQMSAS